MTHVATVRGKRGTGPRSKAARHRKRTPHSFINPRSYTHPAAHKKES